MALHFKHFYEKDIASRGVVAFPSNQNASKYLIEKYAAGDRVLMGLTRNSSSPHRGTIFAVCTLQAVVGATGAWIHPRFAHEGNKWPDCIPIDEMWTVEPRPYALFCDGSLAARVKGQVGKMFPLSDSEELAVQQWLTKATRTPVSVYRAPISWPKG